MHNQFQEHSCLPADFTLHMHNSEIEFQGETSGCEGRACCRVRTISVCSSSLLLPSKMPYSSRHSNPGAGDSRWHQVAAADQGYSPARSACAASSIFLTTGIKQGLAKAPCNATYTAIAALIHFPSQPAESQTGPSIISAAQRRTTDLQSPHCPVPSPPSKAFHPETAEKRLEAKAPS